MIGEWLTARVLLQFICVTASVAILAAVLFRTNDTSRRAFLATSAAGMFVITVILIATGGVLWSLPIDPPVGWPSPMDLPGWLVLVIITPAACLLAVEAWRVGRTHWRLLQCVDARDARLTEHISDVKCALGFTRRVRVIVDERAASPQATSLLRATVIMPSHFAHWPDATLRAVAAHELVHLTRRDDVWLLAWRLLARAYWFLPWMHALPARFRDACEASCDDLAAELCDNPATYCDALAVAARTSSSTESTSQSQQHGTMAALAHALVHRIRRFLNPRAQELDTHSLYWAVLGVLVVLPLGLSVRFGGAPVSDVIVARVIPLSTPALTLREQPSDALLDELPISQPLVSAQFYRVGKTHELIPTLMAADRNHRRAVLPVYPGSALRSGIESDVWIEFGVGHDGRVVQPTIVSDEIPNAFARSSLSAIERSEFQPATYVAGLPPESRTRVRVRYRYRIAELSP